MDEEKNTFTDEFKLIIQNYQKASKPKSELKWSIHMILEKRNKINVEQMNEDEMLKEDLINEKAESGFRDNMINQRMKLEELENMKKQKKKMRKDNILRLLKGKEMKLNNNSLKKETIILPKIQLRQGLFMSPNKSNNNKNKMNGNTQLKNMRFSPFISVNSNRFTKLDKDLNTIESNVVSNPLNTIIQSYSNFEDLKEVKLSEKNDVVDFSKSERIIVKLNLKSEQTKI